MAKKTKSQAAFEFFIAYGWVIVVVIGMIAALTYVSISKMKGAIPDICNINSLIKCEDSKATETGVTLLIWNTMDENVEVVSIAFDKYECSTIFNINLQGGEKKQFDISCDLSGQEKFKSDFWLTYKTKDGVEHKKIGTLAAIIS